MGRLLLNAGTRVKRSHRDTSKRGLPIESLAAQAAFLRLSRLTGLIAPSFNLQFDRGENESILNGLRAVLGVGLLGVGRLGLN